MNEAKIINMPNGNKKNKKEDLLEAIMGLGSETIKDNPAQIAFSLDNFKTLLSEKYPKMTLPELNYDATHAQIALGYARQENIAMQKGSTPEAEILKKLKDYHMSKVSYLK